MKRLIGLLLAYFILVPNISRAGEFELVLGIGVYLGATDNQAEQNIATKNPLGRLSLHYCADRDANKWRPTLCSGVLHISSISTTRDRGLTEAEISMKWVF